jgi:hypothetical protein
MRARAISKFFVNQIRYLTYFEPRGDLLSALDAATYASMQSRQSFSVRTLLKLARNGKIDFSIDRGRESFSRRSDLKVRKKMANSGRRLWFSKKSLRLLIGAHVIVHPLSNKLRVSQTFSSRKVADSRYSPGEVITKEEAAFVLSRSIRGVEYLMSTGRLKAIPLGNRLVVFKDREVRALDKALRRRSGKRPPRPPYRRLLRRDFAGG